MASLPVIAAGAQIAAGVVGAAGQLQQGAAAKDAAYDEALQLEAQGREDFAASQREALMKRREGALVTSRQLALAAASGGGADDASIIKLMSGVKADTEYGAQAILYGGRERRAGLFATARNRRRSGEASLLGAQFGALGSVLGGVAGAAGTAYDMGLFKPMATATTRPAPTPVVPMPRMVR